MTNTADDSIKYSPHRIDSTAQEPPPVPATRGEDNIEEEGLYQLDHINKQFLRATEPDAQPTPHAGTGNLLCADCAELERKLDAKEAELRIANEITAELYLDQAELKAKLQAERTLREQAEQRLAAVEGTLICCSTDYDYILRIVDDRQGLHSWLRMRSAQVKAALVKQEKKKE